MQHETLKHRLVTPWTVLLALLVVVGGAAILYRFFTGLGPTTNLSDQWPWGLWKVANVLCIIVIGAGGFTSAGLIYIFGGERYHGFARSAVLLAVLCYGSAGFSLVFDIGVPWRIVYPIVFWPEHSPLFEVAWCVMLYLGVLSLELAPALIERIKMPALAVVWRKLVPVFTVAGLSFFIYMMTHSLGWTVGVFLFFSLLSLSIPKMAQRPATTPIVLVMFGIILSCLHQSTLGTLFLPMRDKLSHLWWSPMLPVNFLLSAVSLGLCMVMVERTLSAWFFKRKLEEDKLAGVARMAVVAIWVYLVVRVLDLVVNGNLGLMTSDGKAGLFFVEMALVVVPGCMLLTGAMRASAGGRLTAGVLVAAAMILNRFNVGILAMDIPGNEIYTPSGIEILITAAVFGGILLFYNLGAKLLPVFAPSRA